MDDTSIFKAFVSCKKVLGNRGEFVKQNLAKK